MGGVAVRLKLLSPEPAAELRLADPVVAEDHHLDVDDGFEAFLLVEEMCAKLRKAVIVAGQNLYWDARSERLMEGEHADRGHLTNPVW